MLQKALEQKRALNIYTGEHGDAYQWHIVSNLVETLIPKEEVTLEVSHYNASASCIIACLAVLKMLLQNNEGPSTQAIGTLKQVMRENLIKHVSKLEDIKTVVLAYLLDPQDKNHAFSSDITLSKAKEWLNEDVESAKKQSSEEEHATTEEASMEEETAAEEASEEEQAAAEGSGIRENDRRTPKRQWREQTSCCRRIDEMFSSLRGTRTGEPLAKACLEDRLQLYLREPMIDRHKGDPLQWCKKNEGHFKLIATQARKFLCSPPSSERACLQ